MAALTDPRADEQAYRDHERSVLAMLSTRYRDLDPDGRRELYHEAWASVLKRRREGVEIESLRGYLLGAADKLASKRVYGADARRRKTFDPTAPAFTALADAAEQPDEAVLAADEARRVRMFIEELDQAEQALLKLRLDRGMDPPEIRERLGLTDRQYRRTAERAGKALLAQFRAFDRGEWARGKRSLLCACVMGIASDTQRERAQRLIDEDPCCRAMMSELREFGGNAAALLPLPVGTVTMASGNDGLAQRATELFGDVKGGLADLASRVGSPTPGGGGAKDRSLTTLSSVKRQAAETFMGAKQHATNTYVRVADPTPIAGARPGTAAAIVASCVAAGGGAYCAVEGVPESLRSPVGLERSQADTKPPPEAADPGGQAVAHAGAARAPRRPARAAAARGHPACPRPCARTARDPGAAGPAAGRRERVRAHAAGRRPRGPRRRGAERAGHTRPGGGWLGGVLAVIRPVNHVSPGGAP